VAGTGGAAGSGAPLTGGTAGGGASGAVGGVSSGGTSGRGGGASGAAGRGVSGSGGTGAGMGGSSGASAGMGGEATSGRGGASGATGESGAGGQSGGLTCSSDFIAEQAALVVMSFEAPSAVCVPGETRDVTVNGSTYEVATCAGAACDGEIGCGGPITWSEPLHLEGSGEDWEIDGTYTIEFSCTVRFTRDNLVCDCTNTNPRAGGQTYSGPFSPVGSGTMLGFYGIGVLYSGAIYHPVMDCSGDAMPDADDVDACNVGSQLRDLALRECDDQFSETQFGPLTDPWWELVNSWTADCR